MVVVHPSSLGILHNLYDVSSVNLHTCLMTILLDFDTILPINSTGISSIPINTKYV